MKFEMAWWGKVICTLFGILFTISTGVYSGLKMFQTDIKDAKEEAIAYAKEGDEKLQKTMDDRREQRDLELRLREEKYQSQVATIHEKIDDLKSFFLMRDRKRVELQKRDEQLYTNMKQGKEFYEIERSDSSI